jgi:hypothetical protein
MDDFIVSSLHESRNEWAARLVTILTPLVVDGYKSILDEALKLCRDNNEHDKYLMTFQNFVSRIPKWNSTIIETERARICEKSGCAYLEDLITCVHVIQLKILTAMRTGQKQKKIDINIPKIDDFIHKMYINVARKVYKNVYLFEVGIPPLQIQKHHRELEVIVQECILNTVRESIPVDAILKAYLDESVEEDVTEEIREQVIAETKSEAEPSVQQKEPVKQETIQQAIMKEVQQDLGIVGGGLNSEGVKFNDIDYVKDEHNAVNEIIAPKTDQRLRDVFEEREFKRNSESFSGGDESENIRITNESFSFDDIQDLEPRNTESIPDLQIDIEDLG